MPYRYIQYCTVLQVMAILNWEEGVGRRVERSFIHRPAEGHASVRTAVYSCTGMHRNDDRRGTQQEVPGLTQLLPVHGHDMHLSSRWGVGSSGAVATARRPRGG